MCIYTYAYIPTGEIYEGAASNSSMQVYAVALSPGVCIFVRVCRYIYIFVYIYAYIFMYFWERDMEVWQAIAACRCVMWHRRQLYLCVYVYIYIYQIYMYIFLHANIHICIYIPIFIYA